MVIAVFHKVLKKIKKNIDWVSKPPKGRKFIFCAYVIARINTMAMISSNFFFMVDVLGSSSMPQNHYLSIISFLRRSAVKKTYRNQIKNVIL